MSIFANPTPQLLDNNGDPLPGAKLFFFETGTSTLKTIYADSNFTTEQSNPVIADANGRITDDVYLDGLYRIVGQTAEGVNIDGWDKDPVGDIDSGQFGDWSNDATYDENDIVQGSDGEYYKSLTSANQGNDPTTDTTNWAILNLQTLTEATASNIYYGGASSAGTDAYAATLSASPVAYAAGQRFSFLADVANTGACTVNYNAIGDASIKMDDGSDPFDGAIQANSIPITEHDGTNFILQNPYYKADYVPLVGAATKTGDLTLTDELIISSAVPRINIDETGTAADEGKWDVFANGGALVIVAQNDAESASTTALAITRSGSTIANVDVTTGTLSVGGNLAWDDSGSNGPAAVAGYTKAGSGIYRKDVITPYTAISVGTLISVAAPSGATGVYVNFSLGAETANSVAARFVTITTYSNSGGTNVDGFAEVYAYEFNATASGTVINRKYPTILLPVISGNVYFKRTGLDAGAQSTSAYSIIGYTV